MTVYIDDIMGKQHEIICDYWDKDEDRYIFRDDRGKIIAVFQQHGIIGFIVKRKR